MTQGTEAPRKKGGRPRKGELPPQLHGKCWQKGTSGNPAGRPPIIRELRDLARAHTEAAIVALAEVMNDREAAPAARVMAATAILDRGFGRPMQQVATSHFVTTLDETLQRRAGIVMADAIDDLAKRGLLIEHE